MIKCLTGNHRVLEAVENFIKSSHLPHAIIIDGDEGTGRHTLAHFIANSAVCTNENPPCGKCRNCELFANRNHPDIEIFAPDEKKKSLSVEQIRQIKRNAFVKPHLGGKKVFLIEKAENLSEISQNALLKIIEDPPQNILFIFICESAGKLLNTIISRCVIFTLYPPEFSEAQNYLKTVTDKSAEQITEVLHLTHNNIGKSLNLLSKRKNEKNYFAEKFFQDVLNGEPAVNLLISLKSLEKDRVKTQEFITELKFLVSEEAVKSTNNINRLKKLLHIYDVLSQNEDVLNTNINLTLFFTTLVSNLGGSYDTSCFNKI